ncbi:RNA polymerase sigma-54 factor [Acetobacter oeni]|uniref:RNA polymerase sigma-54 factor n=2 Tax=Acetobacter oeni TaxID=304077 RepID=A0A511XI85_9PROT|nr:RNA polymerase sigma-54 factor RpoN [Acetobacter oeni LMG 21952]GEN62660.1 RNA polymerase sigma-54 factor [Acetobacter oeni]
MTPHLRLAIRIMQLSSPEIKTLIEEELQRNPLLICNERDTSHSDEPAPDQIIKQPSLPLPSSDSLKSETLPDSADAPLDTDYDTEASSGGFDDGYSTDGAPVDYRQHGLTQWEEADRKAACPVSLAEKLDEQLRMTLQLTPQQRFIGAGLIARLDATGRLDTSSGDIASDLNVPEEAVETLRILMMTEFEPSGLFAYNLQECLAAQLVAQNRFDPAMAALLKHAELIPGKHYAKLRALCGVNDHDLADMLAELKRLDPKPGFQPDPVTVATIIPDVYLHRIPDGGGWSVQLNDEAVPHLYLDKKLQARVTSTGQKDDQAFIRIQLANANGLIRALEQRSRTMLQVSSEIIRHQYDFLDQGAPGLHPLTLRDIAATTGLHESTVSRVTSGKYISTPQGVFELKYFFTTAIRNMHGGKDLSSEAIRFKIRKMVNTETRDTILSDDDIMRRLRKEGIDIARRTVAKYRDTLHIASSVQRKRERAAPV